MATDTIRIEELDLTVTIPQELAPYTREQLMRYLIDNQDEVIFEFDSYWKYVFQMKSRPTCINGSMLIISGEYGGNAADIYKFDPHACTVNDFEELSVQLA